MKKLLTLSLVSITLLFSSFTSQTSNGGDYKCLIQLKNYSGKAAYVVVSIVDAKGEYQKTLRVLGDDKEWYPDIYSWYAHREKVKHQPSIDGVTGASIINGGRNVVSFKIDDKYINKGYSIRFETAVENMEYYKDDVEVLLTDDNLKKGTFTASKGYIRQVRLIPLAK